MLKLNADYKESKLLLLYLFSKFHFNLSEYQVLRMNAEYSFMNCFELLECLFDLNESKLIETIETVDGKFYAITAGGVQTYEQLSRELRLSFKKKIDQICDELMYDLRLESEMHGDYHQIRDNEYLVTLKITENHIKIFEINLTVYSLEDAKRITGNWKRNSITTYQNVLLNINS